MIEKTLEIYTDASGSTDILGIGVLFIEDERETRFQYKTSNIFLNKEFGLPKNMIKVKSSTSSAEAYAVLRALENLYKEYDKITLYTDSNHVYQILNDNCKKCKQELFNKIIEKCKILMKDINIEVRHIKAHVNVYGNEIVDKLAKNATIKKKGRRIPFTNEHLTEKFKISMIEFDFMQSIKLDFWNDKHLKKLSNS